MDKLKKLLYGKNKWIAAAVVIIVTVAGVMIHRSMTFPAKECVQTIMNVMYKGISQSDKDIEFLTGENGVDAQELYDEAVDARKETFKQYFGITELTEEGEEKLEEFVKDLYCNYVIYDIKGTKKKGDNYVVTVEVSPLAFDSLVDKDKTEDTFRKQTEDGDYMKFSEAEYQTEFLKLLVENYEDALSKDPDYNKEKEYTMTLKKSGNTYVPSQKDYNKIERALIDFSK